MYNSLQSCKCYLMHNILQFCSCCLMYRSIQPCYCYSFQNFTVLCTAVYSPVFIAWVLCDTDQVDLVAAVFEDGNGLLVVHILQRDPVNTHHSVIYPAKYKDKLLKPTLLYCPIWGCTRASHMVCRFRLLIVN